MNIAKFARTTIVAGLMMVSLSGLPQAVRAEELAAESGDGSALQHGTTVLAWARVDGVVSASDTNKPPVTDDVVVDGRIITAENHDNDRIEGDLTASGGDDETGQTSQPDSEWKYVPVRRATEASFDGRLLTAADLSSEQSSEVKPAP